MRLLKEPLVCRFRQRDCLLGAGVLGHGFGAFRHGVLGQLSGEQQADGGLDLPGRDGGSLVVVSQAGSLASDALKDVVNKRVHDAHRPGGDAGVWVDLLQDLVHIDSIALLPGFPPLFILLPGRLGNSFLRALLWRYFRLSLRHNRYICAIGNPGRCVRARLIALVCKFYFAVAFL